MSAYDSTIEPEILPAIPDFSRALVVQDNDSQGNDLQPTKMSPMDSVRAIFEEIRDGINELIIVTKSMASPGQSRDDLIDDADVKPGLENDSQGNSSFGGFPEVPEVGPKLGLALMLGALTALFAYGDEIAKAIEPVLEAGAKVVEKLGIKGTLYTGLGLLAGIKFGPAVYKLLTKGIPDGFAALKAGFGKMKTFVMETAPNAIKGAYGGAKGLVMKAFGKLKLAFTAMKVFLLETLIPSIASAYGGAKGKLIKAVSSLGKAFTAMRLFLVGTMIPAITAFMAPFIIPLALLTAAVAAAVAIFTSIKAGIDEFKKSLDEGDSMLVAIIEGVSTALLTLVTLPITLIKNFVAWVAEKLGFEGIAEKLREFSIVDFIKDGIKGLVLKAKDFILGLFNIDFKGILGKGLDILGAIMTRIKAIAAAGFAAVKAAFPGGESPGEAFDRVYQERIAKAEESEPVVDEGMPSPERYQQEMDQQESFDKLRARAYELYPFLENQENASGMSAAEFNKQQQELYGKVILKAQDPDVGKEIIKGSIERTSKQGTVVTTINNTDASNTNNSTSNTTNTGDLAVDGTDTTAKYLAAAYGR